jgi:hypothetical protein
MIDGRGVARGVGLIKSGTRWERWRFGARAAGFMGLTPTLALADAELLGQARRLPSKEPGQAGRLPYGRGPARRSGPTG